MSALEPAPRKSIEGATLTRQDADILGEQIRYYRDRASEYDDWFLRRGRYDRGEDHRRAWFAEVEQVEEALRAAGPRGQILELAAGTGLWTGRLLPFAEHLTAVDASPEVLRLNRGRLVAEHRGRVEYREADLFAWLPPRRYDFVFFGFWISHVPPERFDEFWSLIRRCLAPGGRVFFVDNALSDARGEDGGAAGCTSTPLVERSLEDGRRYRIVKVFYEPTALEQRLASLGWRAWVAETKRFFLYGCVEPEPGDTG